MSLGLHSCPLCQHPYVSTTHTPEQLCHQWSLKVQDQCVDPKVASAWCRGARLPKDAALARKLTNDQLVGLPESMRAQMHVFHGEIERGLSRKNETLVQKLKMSEQVVMKVEAARVLLEQELSEAKDNMKMLNNERAGYASDVFNLGEEKKELMVENTKLIMLRDDKATRLPQLASDMAKLQGEKSEIQRSLTDLSAQHADELKTSGDAAIIASPSSECWLYHENRRYQESMRCCGPLSC